MTERLSAQQLRRRILETSTQLELLLAQLRVDQMNQPGAVGVWSIKDVIAHLAYWQRYACQLIRAAKSGETPDLEGDDETERSNASVVKQYYQRPLSSVIADWQSAREELLEMLELLDDRELNVVDAFPWNNGRTLLDRLEVNSFEHEADHIAEMREWMHSNGYT